MTTLTWEELQRQAEEILANAPSGDFIDIPFTTGTGGSPSNKADVPEVHRSNHARYNTVRNGRAYAGEVVIRCRDTGTIDKNGLEIHQAENGNLFVYRHQPGSPEYFDSGHIEIPKLA